MKESNSEILIKFGKRLAETRKSAGLSQEKLAELCDLHRTYIGMIERGEKNITLKNIEKIANALQVDMSYLLKDLNG